MRLIHDRWNVVDRYGLSGMWRHMVAHLSHIHSDIWRGDGTTYPVAQLTPSSSRALCRWLSSLHAHHGLKGPICVGSRCCSPFADTWGMKYNPHKCFIMAIVNNKKPPQHFHRPCGWILTQIYDTQYLGTTIAGDLRRERHIATTTANANRMIWFLLRNLSRCPR